jgi:hypothetical protein
MYFFSSVLLFLWVDSNSDPSVVPPVASRYTDYAIPASSISRYKLSKCLAYRQMIVTYTDRLWFYRIRSYKITSQDREYAEASEAPDYPTRRRTREWNLCGRNEDSFAQSGRELWGCDVELLQLEFLMPRISCNQMYYNLSIDLLVTDTDAYLMLALYNNGC